MKNYRPILQLPQFLITLCGDVRVPDTGSGDQAPYPSTSEGIGTTGICGTWAHSYDYSREVAIGGVMREQRQRAYSIRSIGIS